MLISFFELSGICIGTVIILKIYRKLYKPKNHLWENLTGIAFILCVIFAILGVRQWYNIQKPIWEQEEQQRQLEEEQQEGEKTKKSFLRLWHDVCFIDVNLNTVWNTLYMPTVTATRDGKIDYVTAYSNFKKLNNFSQLSYEAANKLEVPEGLSDEQEKKIKDAIKAYQISVSSRCNASSKLMEIIDNNSAKPSDIAEISEDVEDGQKGSEVIMDTLKKIADEKGIELTSPEEEANTKTENSNLN